MLSSPPSTVCDKRAMIGHPSGGCASRHAAMLPGSSSLLAESHHPSRSLPRLRPPVQGLGCSEPPESESRAMCQLSQLLCWPRVTASHRAHAWHQKDEALALKIVGQKPGAKCCCCSGRRVPRTASRTPFTPVAAVHTRVVEASAPLAFSSPFVSNHPKTRCSRCRSFGIERRLEWIQVAKILSNPHDIAMLP